jgi:hypothetical protein
MRKALSLICILLLIATPAAAKPKDMAAPQATQNKGPVYMPVRSLAGQFGCRVDYHPRRTPDVITLTFPNRVVTIRISTRAVTYGSTTAFLPNPIQVNPGTAFVPINDLTNILINANILAPGKGQLPRNDPPAKETPALGNTVISFARPADRTLKFSLLPEQPRLIVGKASDILVNLGTAISPNATVLVAYRGQVTSGGHSIRIDTLTLDKKTLKLGVTLTDPAPNTGHITVTGYPYDVVVLPQSINTDAWVMTRGLTTLAQGTPVAPPVSKVQQPFTRLGMVGLKFAHRPSTHDVVAGPASLMLDNYTGYAADRTVVAVYRGLAANSGFGLMVTGAERSGTHLYLTVQNISPDPNTAYPPVESYPYDVIALPGTTTVESFTILLDGQIVREGKVKARLAFTAADKSIVGITNINTAVAGVHKRTVTINGQDRLLVVVSRGTFAYSGYDIAVTGAADTRTGRVVLEVVYTDPATTSGLAQVINDVYRAYWFDPKYVDAEFVIAVVDN